VGAAGRGAAHHLAAGCRRGVGFRGLITRSVGSWFADPRAALIVGIVVANLLFMVAHVSSDLWLNAYYLLFGIALSITVWRTGGLEVSCLLHVVNNVLLFGIAAIFANGEVSFDRSSGVGGPFLLLPIGMVLITAVGVSWRTARQQDLRSVRMPNRVEAKR
jgi:uncharacterized protein